MVFTAGIGENSALVRKKTMSLLQHVIGNNNVEGCILDETLNEQNGKHSNGVISHIHSNPVIMVVHTDEECSIFDECTRLTNVSSQ